MNSSEPHSTIVDRLRGGDPLAAGELFEQFRTRLKQMVRLRLDRRVQGRLDTSDVLQEAFIDVQKKAAEFPNKGELSPYLWLRLVVSERLIILHRHHLGAQMRDASQVPRGFIVSRRFANRNHQLPGESSPGTSQHAVPRSDSSRTPNSSSRSP